MAEEDPEGTTETGGSLRAKLEASQAENREMAKTLRPLLAAQVIAEKAYKYVKPEDLADVPLTELATKAEILNKQKGEVHEQVVRTILAEQGVADADLDTAVQRFLNPDAQESHADTSTRLASLGRIAGTAPESDKDKGAHGQDLIELALQQKYDSNSRRR
jgi:hypothetical protein